ncbi:hypothetical protein [Candidatus Amarobacter glycogenicus]|uniref:hypothetical protein n=1 Tax=Candidatus Amarobacter glycogenicus TaxID=3140699 RepID=UPI0031350626|nr:hypothetical protein [Dehalococcoidia bacterium]
MPRPLAAVITLGCKLNTADSEEIARSLHQVGFDVVDSVCEADAFVINTCSVTHVADAKSRKLIRSVRRLAPHAAVTVTGCFAQAAGAQAIRSLGVDYVAGTRDSDKVALVEFLLPYAKAPTAPGRELRTPIRGLGPCLRESTGGLQRCVQLLHCPAHPWQGGIAHHRPSRCRSPASR